MHQLTDVIVREVIILCFVPDLLNVLKYTAITLGASLNYAFSATLTSITSGRRKYASPISSAHQIDRYASNATPPQDPPIPQHLSGLDFGRNFGSVVSSSDAICMNFPRQSNQLPIFVPTKGGVLLVVFGNNGMLCRTSDQRTTSTSVRK